MEGNKAGTNIEAMNKIMKELARINIKITSFDNLDGGINSKVLQVRDNNGIPYVLKLYKAPNEKDIRRRRENEENIEKYMRNPIKYY